MCADHVWLVYKYAATTPHECVQIMCGLRACMLPEYVLFEYMQIACTCIMHFVMMYYEHFKTTHALHTCKVVSLCASFGT